MLPVRLLSTFGVLSNSAQASLRARHVSDGASFGWRMPCDAYPRIQRLDPIMAPGKPANHGHMFFGSSRFHANLTYEDLRASNCSSCRVTEDKSAYWIPPLYFLHTNGTYEQVPIFGGILVYYMRRDDDIEAFPDGFKMIAGNAFRRNSTLPAHDTWDTSRWTAAEKTEDVARERATGFLCLGNPEQEGALQRHRMPTREFIASTCPEGLRAELAFPSCWDGKNIDSPNHKDHVAYDEYVYTGGSCPKSHPVRLPTLLYEVVFDTTRLAKQDGEFVWSFGDKSGMGWHADFMNGWDGAFLKRALEECKQDVGDIERLPCNLFTFQDKAACKAENYAPLPELSKEVCNGSIDKLCGSEYWIDGNTKPQNNANVGDAAPSKQTKLGASVTEMPPSSSTLAFVPSQWHPPMVAIGVPSASVVLQASSNIASSLIRVNIATVETTIVATKTSTSPSTRKQGDVVAEGKAYDGYHQPFKTSRNGRKH